MDFYVTLPASTIGSNTSSRFVTHLPETLVLDKSRHVIGLTEIIFPASNYNVHTSIGYTITDVKNEKTRVSIPRGNYTDAASILQHLNNQRQGVNFVSDGALVSLRFNEPAKSVQLDRQLAYFLGFDRVLFSGSANATRPIDFSNNVNTMFIYCSAVGFSIVGDTKSNLIQCVPLPGVSDFGKMQSRAFNPVRYLRPANERIDSIAIELLDEFGQPIQFNFGATIVTLHVKSVQVHE